MIRRSFLASGAAAMMPLPASSAPVLHVPAEDAPHQATFMQWPVSREVYHDSSFLRETQQTIADIANRIVDFEPVILLASAEVHQDARRLLSRKVTIWDIPTEDLWCRDAGPLFAKRGDKTVISHIQFNGWGDKQVHTHDSQIAAQVADRLGLPLIPSGLIGEAGGVDHDGHSYLIAHESSWLNPNRNPGLSRSTITDRLKAAYGADQIIWTKGVYDQDITDYHIDSLARFTAPARVLMNLPKDPDPGDPFHKAAGDTHAALIAAGLDVEIIPEPTRHRVQSFDFVASYANYYVCNSAVIAAEFGDPETDASAVDALQRHYPGREIVTLNVDPLGELGGGIHCATQQMPA